MAYTVKESGKAKDLLNICTVSFSDCILAFPLRFKGICFFCVCVFCNGMFSKTSIQLSLQFWIYSFLCNQSTTCFRNMRAKVALHCSSGNEVYSDSFAQICKCLFFYM